MFLCKARSKLCYATSSYIVCYGLLCFLRPIHHSFSILLFWYAIIRYYKSFDKYQRPLKSLFPDVPTYRSLKNKLQAFRELPTTFYTDVFHSFHPFSSFSYATVSVLASSVFLNSFSHVLYKRSLFLARI